MAAQVQQFGVLTDEVILRIANGGQPGNVADSLALVLHSSSLTSLSQRLLPLAHAANTTPDAWEVYGLFAQRSPSFGTVLKAATIGGDTDTHAAISMPS
jgi:hypothetical protein